MKSTDELVSPVSSSDNPWILSISSDGLHHAVLEVLFTVDFFFDYCFMQLL